MTASVRAAALLLTTVLLAPGLAAADPPVVFSEEPLLPPRTVTLVEEWRRGGPDDDLLFGMVVATAVDAAGNLYALDSQLSCVEVLGPDGSHLRTLSGEGDGPGEVRAPQGMAILPDGSVGILRFVPAEIVRVAADGTPLGTWPVHPRGLDGADAAGGFAVSFGMAGRGGTVAVAGYRSTPTETGQARRLFLSRFAPDGTETACFRESRMTVDFNAIRFVESEFLPPFLLAFAVGPDGRVHVPAARDRYAVAVHAPDGTVERIVARPFVPRRRTARERRRLEALVEAWGRQVPYEVPSELEAVAPPVTDLQVDDEGVLWVQHSRSAEDRADGVMLTFDTFDAEGRWLQEVRVRADGDPALDGVRFLGGDRAVLIRGYVLARWASRGARDAQFDEDDARPGMELAGCRVVAADP